MAELLALEKHVMRELECEDSGELTEFVGCKIDYHRNKQSLRMSQPVLLQSFQDEFDIHDGNERPKTPGIPEKTLQLRDKPPQGGERNTYFRSEVGKPMHLRRWSRPELSCVMRDYPDTTLTVLKITLMQCIEQ
jgi:hypothetical protein